MKIQELRSRFPQLKESVYGKPLVYLDNAATSMRLDAVVDKWEQMSLKFNSNLHRAVHAMASKATEEYESARLATAVFLNCSEKEIVFTSGATDSLNLLAFSLGESAFFEEGDEILICEGEHHSDIVPWQMLANRKGLSIKVLPINENGEIALSQLLELIGKRTKLCCVAHVSNVLGIINPVAEIARICHEKGCLLSVDGAQAVQHLKVDVRSLDCDFYSFSAHKMFAAPGVGVLYGKLGLLERMQPYQGGGEMIESVSWKGTSYAGVPHRFEAGTRNISSVPAIKPALAFLNDLFLDKEIIDYQENIIKYLLQELNSVPGLHLYGVPSDPSRKIPLFSFTVDGVHHEDLALVMDKMGIALRSGQMCAEPLMVRFGVSGMLRASFAPYNSMEEAEYFTASLKKAISMLK